MKEGMHVKVVRLESTKGMLIAKRYLDARRKGAIGMVMGYVPGHGGDVWWVRHENGTVAAYCYTELKEAPNGE